MESRGQIGIIACSSGKPFAEKILAHLKEITKKEGKTNGIALIDSKEMHFANSEVKTEINESIRGRDIFIVQDVENSVAPYSVNDNIFALISAAETARASGASHITAVIPVFPYARQDKSIAREGIMAGVVARQLQAVGVDRIITLDVHNEAIAGHFNSARFENLHASKNIMDFVREKIGLKNLVVLSPDLGGARRANHYAKTLGAGLAMMHKKRDYSKVNEVEEVTLLGDVRGKRVLIVDDMIDTAGTAVKTIRTLKKQHNPEEIHFACSLPLLNGEAKKLLSDAHSEGVLNSVIGTDAVYHGGDEFLRQSPWYSEVSVAKYFARVIFNVNCHMPVSDLLK